MSQIASRAKACPASRSRLQKASVKPLSCDQRQTTSPERSETSMSKNCPDEKVRLEVEAVSFLRPIRKLTIPPVGPLMVAITERAAALSWVRVSGAVGEVDVPHAATRSAKARSPAKVVDLFI